MAGATAAAPALSRQQPKPQRVPWPARSRQRFLCCLVCSDPELCSSGLCRRCYDAAYHSETCFGGLKEEVLERDGRRCRACGEPTEIVHHRRPGVNELAWLVAVCARCHAVIHRLEQLDRYLPLALIELWREQHPAARVEQLQLAWETPP
jgi:hypothetical protein